MSYPFFCGGKVIPKYCVSLANRLDRHFHFLRSGAGFAMACLASGGWQKILVRRRRH